jgi:hypothetical protein
MGARMASAIGAACLKSPSGEAETEDSLASAELARPRNRSPKTSSAEGAEDWTGGTTLRGCLVVACNRSMSRRIASVAPSALASFN